MTRGRLKIEGVTIHMATPQRIIEGIDYYQENHPEFVTRTAAVMSLITMALREIGYLPKDNSNG